MKRLLQIALDTLLISILPIIMWILLGIIMTKEISNVFSLTYPLQFFFMLFEAIFSRGPNITAKKEKDPNIVHSNILLGILVTGILVLTICLNINSYMTFMNIDPSIYHNYCLYSVIWLYLSFIVQMILQKLYFENKTTTSNKINLIFNITNFLLIISLSCLTKDYIATTLTLIVDTVLTLIILYRNIKIPKFRISLKNNIRYSSFSILRNLCMLLTYGIGMRRSFGYGEKFITATNFESMTTDTQWDVLYSVDTVAKIDLANEKFDYKESLKNAYKLLTILITSTILMNLVLYWFYKPDLKILTILLLIQFIDMLTDPLKTLRIAYLQVNESTPKHNIFMTITRAIRVLCVFIPSAFCTYISQLVSMTLLLVYSMIQCRKVPLFKLKK